MDAAAGKELLTLGDHDLPITSDVAWRSDGKRLAAGSEDGKVRVYTMDVRDLMALARQRVTAHPYEEGCKKYLHADKCRSFPTLSLW